MSSKRGKSNRARPGASGGARQSAWYRKAKGERSRRVIESHLRDGLRLVRRLYLGFDPSQGYDLRRVRYWSDARVRQLNRFIAEARHLTSGEFHRLYTLHRPRSDAQRQALILHTGQLSPDESRHAQRAWVVYANTRRVQVRYVKERVLVAAPMGRPIYEERLRAEVRQPVKGGALVHRDYLFREVLGFQPGLESSSPEGLRAARVLGTYDPWEQMIRAMRMLLPRLPDRTPKGNEAYYRLLSDRGPVSTSVPKHMLLERLQDWADEYDPRFTGFLMGVRYQGDEFRAVRGAKSLDAQAERRRARYQQLMRERLLIRGRPKPRPKRKSKKSARGKK